jgi:uncharacterized membrane protein
LDAAVRCPIRGAPDKEKPMSTVEESIEIDVPVALAYDQWTQFESFPQFMDGVQEVRQLDATHLHWKVEIGGHAAEWDAEITDQRPDQRIAWKSTGGTPNDGVVTFAPIDDGSSRVTVAMEHGTEGIVETAGSALGFDSRQVKADLERFKELIEKRHATSGGRWVGQVDTSRGPISES